MFVFYLCFLYLFMFDLTRYISRVTEVGYSSGVYQLQHSPCTFSSCAEGVWSKSCYHWFW